MSRPASTDGPLVSVIVPVFEVREFVAQCLASITGQTYPTLEIIVVDDGSSDGSGAICDEIAATDARIVVIHQPNAGLSAARNAGLDRATGAYLTLVDSDDILAPDFVDRLLADCLTHDADLAVTGFVAFSSEPPAFVADDAIEVLRTPDELERLITGLPPRWEGQTKLYRAALFAGLRFHEGVLYEDLELSPRLLARLRSVVVRGDRLYGYRQRAGSIMERTRRGISPDLITVLDRTITSADTLFAPPAARRLRRAFLVHASRQLEDLPAGAAWRESRAFRSDYRAFVRRHARSIATDQRIAPAYRTLMLLSGVSTTAFKGSFAAARWAKAHLPVDLRRQPGATAAPSVPAPSGAAPSAAARNRAGSDRAVTFIYRGQLGIERSRIAFLLRAVCLAFPVVDVVHLSPGLGADEAALRDFTADFPQVRAARAVAAGSRGVLGTRRRVADALAPDARDVIAVGFTAGPFVPGRLRAWCVNGIPEERLLTTSGRRARAAVRLSWLLAGRVRSDVVVVVSEPMARLARQRLRPSELVVVPNTVDGSDFAADATVKPHFLTYQGGGAPWQGLDRLAGVWGELHRLDPSLRFRVISRDPRTAGLAGSLPAEVVEFVSSDDPAQVGRWLTEARLGFVFREPNLVNEVAWPMKFGEYLAAGVPVVLSACGWDLQDVVIRHDAGLVVDWDAPPARTAAAIHEYLQAIGQTRPAGVAAAAAELDSDAWVGQLAYRLGARTEGRAHGA